MKQLAPKVVLEGEATLGDNKLFNHLILEVKNEGWTCLLGSSGAGKTTILRFIAGLHTAAFFHGKVSTSDGMPLNGRLSYMAQSDLLLPWATVVQNVTLGARLRGSKINRELVLEVIDRVGLSKHDTKKPASLSGGQRQRVALARTLLEDRPVVLLDEPFSALDARTRSEMQELAAELLKGRTILLVTHDPSEAARLGQAIYILSSKKLEKVKSLSMSLPCSVDDDDLLKLQGDLLQQLRMSS